MGLKKEKTEQAIKPIKDFRQLKHGSYSIVLSVIVIVAVVMINLIAGQIPSQYTQFDFSGLQLSVLTDTTKELVTGLDEDVTIYYICQSGNEDTNVSRLLERYNDLSSHLTVIQKDPVLYPQFTSQYTDSSLTDNSVIIVCGENSLIVDYSDMYEYSFSYTYYSYTTTGFDAEGQITSAVALLTSEDTPKLYTLTGHGESDLDSTLTDSITKQNIEVEELNLISADAVPEDASCLLIMPVTDISSGEAQKIINYLRRGGSAIIITDYTTEDMTNLQTVLEYYGTTLTEGVVFEGNSNYIYAQTPYYILPDVNSTDVSADLTTSYIVLALAQGIDTLSDMRDDISITSLLTTSSSAYSKINVTTMTTYMQEDEDLDGPFDVAVLITETVELTAELLEETASVDESLDISSWVQSLELVETEAETEEVAEAESEAESEAEEAEEEEVTEAETRIAIFTSSDIVNSSANQVVSGGNFSLFINTLSWACNQETSVSVPVKSVSVDYLTLTSASANFWSIIAIAIIPGLILFVGLGIWLSRRKR